MVAHRQVLRPLGTQWAKIMVLNECAKKEMDKSAKGTGSIGNFSKSGDAARFMENR